MSITQDDPKIDSVNCGEVHGFIMDIIVFIFFSVRCPAVLAASAAKGIKKKQLLLFEVEHYQPGACALLANCGFLCPCKPKAVIPQYRQVVWVSAEGVATVRTSWCLSDIGSCHLKSMHLRAFSELEIDELHFFGGVITDRWFRITHGFRWSSSGGH